MGDYSATLVRNERAAYGRKSQGEIANLLRDYLGRYLHREDRILVMTPPEDVETFESYDGYLVLPSYNTYLHLEVEKNDSPRIGEDTWKGGLDSTGWLDAHLLERKTDGDWDIFFKTNTLCNSFWSVAHSQRWLDTAHHPDLGKRDWRIAPFASRGSSGVDEGVDSRGILRKGGRALWFATMRRPDVWGKLAVYDNPEVWVKMVGAMLRSSGARQGALDHLFDGESFSKTNPQLWERRWRTVKVGPHQVPHEEWCPPSRWDPNRDWLVSDVL